MTQCWQTAVDAAAYYTWDGLDVACVTPYVASVDPPEGGPLLDWVNFPPAQVDIGSGLEDDLAELVQQVTNLGSGFDRWVYWEQQSPGSDIIELPNLVNPDLVRVYLDSAPLSAVDDYEIIHLGARIQLAYPMEPGSELEVRTYGGTA